MCIADHVGQALLDDPVYGELQPGRQVADEPSVDTSTANPCSRSGGQARPGRPAAGETTDAAAGTPRRSTPSNTLSSSRAWRPVVRTDSKAACARRGSTATICSAAPAWTTITLTE